MPDARTPIRSGISKTLPEPTSPSITSAYALAKERYAALDVDTDAAMTRLAAIPISLHCWQGDDVRGFERPPDQAGDIGGGLAVTGFYPGRARNADELRRDLECALALIPGHHRVNLHASYAECGGQRVARNELQPSHFQGWIDWAYEHRLGLDFNPTYFSHELAADGFTLAHPDPGIRQFWVEHGIACRRIGAAMGTAVGSPCVTNVWIPDGSKDTPVDRILPRARLAESLDRIFSEPLNPSHVLDAVEAKLFGLGSESYVVGSHEFYLGYAITRGKMLCLDAGHFHPTECISDKISAVLPYVDRLLLHVSRGVRWDSDHVVIVSDELLAIAQQLVRGDFLDRVHLGLDFFDASINRVAAWVIGARALQKALLLALLEPLPRLRQYESEGDLTSRLALFEELKSLPLGAVWDFFCRLQDVPVAWQWLNDVRQYEAETLHARG
jgi:L-rhamnose isomerase